MEDPLTPNIVSMTIAGWGGRLPFWEEFKEASLEGRVRVEKLQASALAGSGSLPKWPRVFYVYVMLGLLFIGFVGAITLMALGAITWGWFVAGMLSLIFLSKYRALGMRASIVRAALQHEAIYISLLAEGVFFILPPGDRSRFL